MEYIEMCKLVFKHEIVDWELRAYKSRKRQLVQARQVSMYLGNWFYPHFSAELLASPFNQDRCSAMHAKKIINNLMFSDKQMRAKIDRYLRLIRNKINEDNQVESEMEEVFQQNDFFTNN